jgi:putative ABC transport system permease protein
MIKHYLKYSYQILRKDKLFTLLNILGFAIGITVCSLIAFYILYEYSFDTLNKNYDRIYTVYSNADRACATTPFVFGTTIKNKIPGIQKSVQVLDGLWVLPGIVINNKILKIDNCYSADPELLDIFSFEYLSGSKIIFASKINSVLISQNTAVKYLKKDEQAVGKPIKIYMGGLKLNLKIAGIFKDAPGNSHLRPNIIIQIDNIKKLIPPKELNNWNSSAPTTYVLLTNPSVKSRVEQQINKLVPVNNSGYHLLPLADQHLRASNISFLIGKKGDINKIYIYLIIGFFTLLIACINYINFNTAKSAMRAKEIGIRKIAGANRWTLIKQLAAEPLILSCAAIPIVVALLALTLPYADSIFDRDIQATLFTNWNYFFALLALILLTGVLSGIYSAVLITVYKPLDLIRNQMNLKTSKSYFRNSLLFIQIVIFSGLIMSSLIIYRQMQLIKKIDIGYNKYCTLVTTFPGPPYYDQFKTFVKELKNYPGILNGTIASVVPPSEKDVIRMIGSSPSTKKAFCYSYIECDENYKDVIGLTLTEGRFISDASADNEIVINEKLEKDQRLKHAAGKYIDIFGKKLVVGVVKNFYMNSLYEPIEPLFMAKGKNISSYLALRLNPKDLSGGINLFKNKWKQFFPNLICDYFFIDEEFDNKYKDDQYFGTLIGTFSIVASLIAVIGLIGLTTYIISKKKKEIAIRKVLGASVFNIVYVLTKETLIITLFGCLVAALISNYFMEIWLRRFAEKISITPDIFIIGFCITLLITISSVALLAVKAALGNQMDSLRNE